MYIPDHPNARSNGCVLEHRYVVETKIGRFLKAEEVVHHLDEDRTNNSPSNLIVFATHNDHARFHKNGVMIEVEDGVYISPIVEIEKKHGNCSSCNAEIASYYVELCRTCAMIKRRVVERPNKECLIELISENSFLSLGKKFGVSDNAVRKWCKSYDIPLKKRKYSRRD